MWVWVWVWVRMRMWVCGWVWVCTYMLAIMDSVAGRHKSPQDRCMPIDDESSSVPLYCLCSLSALSALAPANGMFHSSALPVGYARVSVICHGKDASRQVHLPRSFAHTLEITTYVCGKRYTRRLSHTSCFASRLQQQLLDEWDDTFADALFVQVYIYIYIYIYIYLHAEGVEQDKT
jgi:hypothetical protein